MIPNLFILSPTGEVLIEKHWRNKVKRTVCELFWEEVSKASTRAEVNPVIGTAKHYMISTIRYDLTLLTVVEKETPPLFVLEAQNRILDVLIEYFGNKINESVCREHFSIIYQLLDEMIDGGFPSTTEPNQLKEMIIPPSLAQRLFQNVTGQFAVAQELPTGAVSKIPWRKSEVKYVTNEIYFDLVEQLDVIIGPNQNLISGSVYGEIRCNARLSGMPDLTLSFSRPSLLDDCSLHRCVRINRYQRERVISFVPPDGHFKLLTYKIGGISQLPLYVKPCVTLRPGSGKVHIQVGPKFHNDNQPITDVVIILPLPRSTLSTSISANIGVIKHESLSGNLRWEIGKLPKDKTPTLEGSISLPVDYVPDEMPTVRAEFQVKMYCISGLKVDGLAIRGVKYKPFKGVRSVTQAGKFQIRASPL